MGGCLPGITSVNNPHLVCAILPSCAQRSKHGACKVGRGVCRTSFGKCEDEAKLQKYREPGGTRLLLCKIHLRRSLDMELAGSGIDGDRGAWRSRLGVQRGMTPTGVRTFLDREQPAQNYYFIYIGST